MLPLPCATSKKRLTRERSFESTMEAQKPKQEVSNVEASTPTGKRRSSLAEMDPISFRATSRKAARSSNMYVSPLEKPRNASPSGAASRIQTLGHTFELEDQSETPTATSTTSSDCAIETKLNGPLTDAVLKRKRSRKVSETGSTDWEEQTRAKRRRFSHSDTEGLRGEWFWRSYSGVTSRTTLIAAKVHNGFIFGTDARLAMFVSGEEHAQQLRRQGWKVLPSGTKNKDSITALIRNGKSKIYNPPGSPHTCFAITGVDENQSLWRILNGMQERSRIEETANQVANTLNSNRRKSQDLLSQTYLPRSQLDADVLMAGPEDDDWKVLGIMEDENGRWNVYEADVIALGCGGEAAQAALRGMKFAKCKYQDAVDAVVRAMRTAFSSSPFTGPPIFIKIYGREAGFVAKVEKDVQVQYVRV